MPVQVSLNVSHLREKSNKFETTQFFKNKGIKKKVNNATNVHLMFAKFPQRMLGELVGAVKNEKRTLEATLPPPKHQRSLCILICLRIREFS